MKRFGMCLIFSIALHLALFPSALGALMKTGKADAAPPKPDKIKIRLVKRAKPTPKPKPIVSRPIPKLEPKLRKPAAPPPKIVAKPKPITAKPIAPPSQPQVVKRPVPEKPKVVPQPLRSYPKNEAPKSKPPKVSTEKPKSAPKAKPPRTLTAAPGAKSRSPVTTRMEPPSGEVDKPGRAPEPPSRSSPEAPQAASQAAGSGVGHREGPTGEHDSSASSGGIGSGAVNGATPEPRPAEPTSKRVPPKPISTPSRTPPSQAALKPLAQAAVISVPDIDPPAKFRKERLKGNLKVRFQIEADGTFQVSLFDSSGNQEFDDFVLAKIKETARIEPALDDEGKPKRSTVRKPVNITID